MENISTYKTNIMIGLAVETKPVNVPPGSEFYEVDTGLLFVFDGGSWSIKSDVSLARSYVWNPSTLSWEALTNTEVTVGELTVSGVAISNWPSPSIIKVDSASSSITYIGEAVPGSLDNSSVWRIKRIDTTSGVVILFADGDTNYNNRWDQRTAKSYS